MDESLRIAIVGGGASGFFTAINAGELAQSLSQNVQIDLFESSNQFLKKVKISGGGRCNVTHHLFEVRDFVKNYPRGEKPLISPMNQFQAEDTVRWFQERGVELVPEADGRMFPTTHSSQTIIDCFLEQARQFNVQLHLKSSVKNVEHKDGIFQLHFQNQEIKKYDRVVLATGSSPLSYTLSENLGHSITERAPSLFSFKIKNPLLDGLSGTSFNQAKIELQFASGKKYKGEGPILITHWGLSGPAILKLSAWAAREFKKAQYQAQLRVNWLGLKKEAQITDLLNQLKNQFPKNQLKNRFPENLSKHFWQKLIETCGLSLEKQWAQLNKKELSQLTKSLWQYEFQIDGQNRFKDEFVECGGVSLKEIDMKTMQSKQVPGLFFTGELMDVDGITGGFNFQNAWTSGWIVAQNLLNSGY